MFDGKLKAVTFSYDDGVTQDRRLIELFNKYSLKGTFNINSEFLDMENTLTYGNKSVAHNKVSRKEIKSIVLPIPYKRFFTARKPQFIFAFNGENTCKFIGF